MTLGFPRAPVHAPVHRGPSLGSIAVTLRKSFRQSFPVTTFARNAAHAKDLGVPTAVMRR
jgi:hypothetical protein